ncbi:hypothetical protein OE88DRAFT_1641628 [Heliocybe sulcata]|uniref:Uncharacterized protein n=1 Tax=Heliocybe sulcata TaxID=5364 RepID=A0A5C3NG14_9AGAM|nr:hypothetical protein OE88DRAFT_1641628 [Heliocybe sulcata]
MEVAPEDIRRSRDKPIKLSKKKILEIVTRLQTSTPEIFIRRSGYDGDTGLWQAKSTQRFKMLTESQEFLVPWGEPSPVADLARYYPFNVRPAALARLSEDLQASEHLAERPPMLRITFIIVSKRHHIRFFPDKLHPQDPRNAEDDSKTGNCRPGLVVDKVTRNITSTSRVTQLRGKALAGRAINMSCSMTR